VSIPIDNVRYGAVSRRDFFHMTGGLRGVRSPDGWMIGPMQCQSGATYCGPLPEEQIVATCKELGVMLFGADEISSQEQLLPTRIWTPLLGVPRVGQPADAWGMIAGQARVNGDDAYASIAAKVSYSLRAAGLRLRDASDEYHRQLLAALERRQPCGRRFQNVPAWDLHLAFHSLLAELASARDYLATFAARRVGAPDRIDALARLNHWLGKSGNQSQKEDPLILAFIDACNSDADDPWLFDLSEYRNQFLHREPLGTNEHARWLILNKHESSRGVTLLIQVFVPAGSKSAGTCEALGRFVDLHAKMCRLADFVASFAPYKAEPVLFQAMRR
jgi:hypothetical protein